MLLGLLFFNFTGYRWLLSFMEQQATIRLEQRLDAGDYDESTLVEVKIPLNLPYHNNWNDYEVFYGQANYNGEFYQYVKRKVSNDTLYLLCIPHDEKTQLNAAKTDIIKSVNDISNNGNQNTPQRPALVKLIQTEFTQSNNELLSAIQLSELSILSVYRTTLIQQFDPESLTPPPKIA